ncbi:hypothetical protein [Microlunatus soli]|uniref:Uncharacterized protein n=1 Tax=Microlunatus soli TaxID=630515 RepID=A0A1H1PTX5_9ACTN|nr:hypothetical protein [Microlunatus soli]SDS14576.1 hypothetical protein SAMN04489812_1020 [Microlunatus soli]
MGWLRERARRLRRTPTGRGATVDDAIVAHLTEFVRTRRGVEALVEPPTAVTQTTMLLIAYDGEWTRRRVPSARWAHAFAEHLQIPAYDAAVVGYPQRMRDYNHRQKLRQQTDRR